MLIDTLRVLHEGGHPIWTAAAHAGVGPAVAMAIMNGKEVLGT
jgi:hypothetical protein